MSGAKKSIFVSQTHQLRFFHKYDSICETQTIFLVILPSTEYTNLCWTNSVFTIPIPEIKTLRYNALVNKPLAFIGISETNQPLTREDAAGWKRGSS
jgi:hypothetical protein